MNEKNVLEGCGPKLSTLQYFNVKIGHASCIIFEIYRIMEKE